MTELALRVLFPAIRTLRVAARVPLPPILVLAGFILVILWGFFRPELSARPSQYTLIIIALSLPTFGL
jgi:hypothetical protein